MITLKDIKAYCIRHRIDHGCSCESYKECFYLFDDKSIPANWDDDIEAMEKAVEEDK